MAYNYRHPQYLRSRRESLDRSSGICQFCGQREATDVHHWATEYGPEEEVTPEDLTALCQPCHEFATEMRRFVRVGGSIHQFRRAFSAAMRMAAEGEGARA